MTRTLACSLGLFVALCLQPQAARSADEIHAGFRKTTLQYKSDDGERKRNVLLWYPTATVAERYSYRPQIGLAAEGAAVLDRPSPLILFSHGYLGVADQTIFLTEELARRGYIVAGLNHADSLFEKRDKPLPAPNFTKPETWDDTKYRDRREDLVALLDQLLQLNRERDSYLFHRIEAQQIGAVGHSLGGYTVLGLSGGWDSWRDERIKACVALSPYSQPFVKSDRASTKGIRVPVMFQGGTLDFGITPFIEPLYDKLPAPKCFLTLKGETHFGWTNLASLGQTTTECIQKGNPELITNYTAAFFDCHLRGQPASELLTKENERLQSYLHAEQ